MDEKDSNFSSQKFPSSSQVVDELKELWSMALPITAMNFLVYIRSMVSVLFLGWLGSLELAGGALSIGFTNTTGYSVLVGLASGLEPVCSQAYGSRNWEVLGLSLHRMILVLFAMIIPIAVLWFNLESIMLSMGQDKDITSMAASYCLYSLPDLVINSLLQPFRVYLRSQGVTQPQMWCTLIAVIFHIPLNYLLVVVMGLGVPGVAIASVLTNFQMMVLLMMYVCLYGRWEWRLNVSGFFNGIRPLLGLAIPSCVAICLEWWWYEIITLLAGYLPNPKVTVAATGIIIQTTSLMYNVPIAIAGCVSARVGNELGAGKPYKARLAAMVALACAFAIGFVNVFWTVVFRREWVELFTRDEEVKALVAGVLPLIGLCEVGNCPQTTGCGILRGTARPAVGARINLVSFYLVGTPVAVGMAFWLRFGFAGLWLGLLSAQVACLGSILYVVHHTEWDNETNRMQSYGLDEPGINDGEERKRLMS